REGCRPCRFESCRSHLWSRVHAPATDRQAGLAGAVPRPRASRALRFPGQRHRASRTAPGVSEVNIQAALVRSILEKYRSYEWTVQGFGFVRTKIANVGR